jgi:hypothetical protein
MIVNLFKDGLFESLKKYNQEIIDVCDKHKILPFGQGNDKDSSAWWFDPREIQKLHLTSSWRKNGEIIYPEPDERVYESRFCLILHVPNYLALWLTNKLMPKDSLFEDLGCGLSQVSFYLTKLGFKNISLVENFQFIARPLFDEFISHFDADVVVNGDTEPRVTNIVGHHPFPKKLSSSNELIISYEKPELLDVLDGMKDYKFLCKDSDGFSHAYARADKHDEFMEKLNDSSN